ncbi:uncharacterized protein LOC124263275 [Haliotis rubra]|uniref:uncharacterized protein LOC124263275 n=1 Tax=Haliotis rubra TaxID=36100 RepID=UPI001EE5DF38|nr:uncharacterized protein LOC124263275 [Haliotis rubra]
MHLTTLAYVAAVLVTEVSQNVGQMCTDVRSVYHLKKGVRLSDVQIHSFKASGLMICVRYCLLKTGCKSINYNIGTGMCELNSHSFMDSAPSNIQDAAFSFVQSDIENWPTTLAGPCVNHTCSRNSRCVASPVPECVVSGCLRSDIPEISYTTLNTTVSYLESPVGTVLKYICDKEFLPETRVECDVMGNWTFTNCQLAVPSSCASVKQCQPNSTDGEYWMRLPKFHFYKTRIYCHDMRTGNPREYLTLQFHNHGIFPAITNWNCGGEGKLPGSCLSYVGEVWYEKIRVDLQTMEIKQDETTFARFSGNPPKYGSAFDCYTMHYNRSVSQCGVKGEFTINLRKTGWIVSPDQKWREVGWNAAMDISYRNNGTVIHLRCGGYAGGCSPNGPLLLVPNMADIVEETSAKSIRCE